MAKDFERLENGDNTVIGEKGSTLSGGQRMRLGIARALYADADIYIFDDPMSSLNSSVAAHIS